MVGASSGSAKEDEEGTNVALRVARGVTIVVVPPEKMEALFGYELFKAIRGQPN